MQIKGIVDTQARNLFEFFSRAFDREPFEIKQLDIQRALRVFFVKPAPHEESTMRESATGF